MVITGPKGLSWIWDGAYRNCKSDMNLTDNLIKFRLQGIFKSMNGRVRLVLHGTNDFPPELTQACIKAGVTKVNVNKLVLDPWHDNLRANATRPLTELMDTGIEVLTTEMERWMDIIGSSGKASQ